HRLSLSGRAVPLGGGRGRLRVRAVAARSEPGRAAARRRAGGRQVEPARSSAHAHGTARRRDPEPRRIRREAAAGRTVTGPHTSVIPAKAGIQGPRFQLLPWTPAFAGVT